MSAAQRPRLKESMLTATANEDVLKTPDNAKIDDEIRRKLDIDPDDPQGSVLLDPQRPRDARMIDKILAGVRCSRGPAILRPSGMRLFYGPPTPVGDGYTNTSKSDVTRHLNWKQSVSTTTSFSVSASVEASYLTIVKGSVSASFGMSWQQSKEVSDGLDVPIAPLATSWLERSAMLCRVEGFFYAYVGLLPIGGDRFRWPAIVTGPGSDGIRPDGLVRIVARPATPAELGEALSIETDEAGTAPAFLLDFNTPVDSRLTITPENFLLGANATSE